MTRPACEVPGCGRPHYGHGFCRAHHGRWLRHGDPRAGEPIAVPTRGDAVLSVSGARRRVRATRGTAAGRRCSGCGGQAAVWCYDGADPAERIDPRGRRYSLDPDRYRPSCRFCLRQVAVDRHAAFPRPRRRPALDVERAARLYAAGASSRGLAALMGVSHRTVLRTLRAHGVAIRPPIAVGRRSRRHRVTADPSTTGSTPNEHGTHDTSHESSIVTTDTNSHPRQRQPSPQPARHTTTTTSTTTSSPRRDQSEGQHNAPRAQSGPTHQRSLGRFRVPCGPAAGDTHDQRDGE